MSCTVPRIDARAGRELTNASASWQAPSTGRKPVDQRYEGWMRPITQIYVHKSEILCCIHLLLPQCTSPRLPGSYGTISSRWAANPSGKLSQTVLPAVTAKKSMLRRAKTLHQRPFDLHADLHKVTCLALPWRWWLRLLGLRQKHLTFKFLNIQSHFLSSIES